MILDNIVTKTKERIEQAKQVVSLNELKKKAEELEITNNFPFEKVLQKEGMSFILEVKKASPSKGDIVEDFRYVDIAKEYEKIGASAISVLTEPYFFKGSNTYLQEIVKAVTIPILRKDFVVDEYMLYEAKLLGASAVLLICSVLSEEQLQNYLEIAHGLGLSCLVETHDETEIAMALRLGARVIGVNNRNLKDFSVDITNSIRMREHVNTDILFVSESGITSRQDIEILEEHHVNAVLIGETIMKAKDKQVALNTLRGKI
jgi:indole-3-glycerol phosphate synthase